MSRAASINSIESIIHKIASLQSRGDSHFPEGIFPSYRQNTFLRYRRPDNNIFYTASIVFVLKQLRSYLSADSRELVDEITSKATPNYELHSNKDGLNTYNFWQTPNADRVSGHFPGGYIFHRMEHFRLPDDIDDTALIYLTRNALKDEVIWLKEKVKQHANLSAGPHRNRQVKNTFSHYKDLKVYSTWFGKNMAIEFDACALCNLLYLFEAYQLTYNEYDIDTYKYLNGIIEREEFISNSFLVAHNYATVPLIIYHFARLLGAFEVKPLEGCREKLIKTALDLFRTERLGMNKIILQTALLRLSRRNDFGCREAIEECLQVQPEPQIPDADFCYFLGPLLSSYEHPVLQFLAPMKITQMDWKCEAHEWVLVLESLIERRHY